MGVVDLFSKRERRARSEMPDVYVYDELPEQLRVQIVHIIRDVFGRDYPGPAIVERLYEFVEQTLCREYGLLELTKSSNSYTESVTTFFRNEELVERVLDVIELCFQYLNHYHSQIDADAAVTELNIRFKEHGVGYQFESNKLIRIDSDFMHDNAVKPTLMVLRDERFKGANEEFLLAYEHYRYGRNKECLVKALNAFESTMKSICQIRGWPFQPNDTFGALIKTCLDKELFPSNLQPQFDLCRSLLKNGVPTVRNKFGGHGQGSEPIVVPEYLVRYALNLTATSILLLVEANSAKE